MELNYDKEFSATNTEETLHQQLGISKERVDLMAKFSAPFITRFMTQEMNPAGGRYPLAEMLKDCVAMATSTEEVVVITFKTCHAMIKVKELMGDPMLAILAHLSSK